MTSLETESIEAPVRFGDIEVTTIVSDEKWAQNCYILRAVTTGKILVVDPGASAERIVNIVDPMGGKIESILLTHAHHDHTRALPKLYERFEVPCFLHKEDARLLRQTPMYALVFDGLKIERFPQATLFESEVELNSSFSFHTLHVPGHTRGSTCFIFDGFLLSGDTLLYQHVGRHDTPESDLNRLKESIDQLLVHSPDSSEILPGHGRRWKVGEAKVWWSLNRANPPSYNRFGTI